MSFAAGAVAYAESRPIQNVVRVLAHHFAIACGDLPLEASFFGAFPR